MRNEADKSAAATAEQVRRLLGELDAETVVQILALHPTLADLELAAVYATGDGEALGKAGRPPAGVAAAIVDILAPEEEEEEPRAR
jgi:hypothetical protein